MVPCSSYSRPSSVNDPACPMRTDVMLRITNLIFEGPKSATPCNKQRIQPDEGSQYSRQCPASAPLSVPL